MNSMMINKWTTWSDFYCESLARDAENLCNLFTGTNRSSPQQSIFVKQQDFEQEMRTLKNQIRTQLSFQSQMKLDCGSRRRTVQYEMPKEPFSSFHLCRPL